jgi:3-oxoacyl-[acyl-carrier-protein] synthase-3
MVATTDQWILERTGIRERHLADKGVAASDLAVEAVKQLHLSHPFDLQEVDLIVVGTVTPDMMYPSTACLVQHKIRRIGRVQESVGDRLRRKFVDDRLH